LQHPDTRIALKRYGIADTPPSRRHQEAGPEFPNPADRDLKDSLGFSHRFDILRISRVPPDSGVRANWQILTPSIKTGILLAPPSGER